MKILHTIRKIFGLYDLRKEGAKWVEKNIGPDYVQEFLEKYDSINLGIPIGGFLKYDCADQRRFLKGEKE